MSAATRTSSTQVPLSGQRLMPILAPTRTVFPRPMEISSPTHSRTFRATAVASSVEPTSCRSRTNSSPPSRATVSALRTTRARRCAVTCNTLSPESWPWTSLISLNPSRSMNMTAAFFRHAVPQQGPALGDRKRARGWEAPSDDRDRPDSAVGLPRPRVRTHRMRRRRA